MKRLPLLPHSPVQPLTKDDRDFRLGYTYSLPKLSEIPNTNWDFGGPPLEIKHQSNTMRCTAAAAAAVAEDHEGVVLDYDFLYAMENLITGRTGDEGGDLRSVAKALVRYGALEKAKSPFLDRPVHFTANPANWPLIYREYAARHKQRSFFLVEGPYDFFDNIRAALWQFREEKCSVLAASYWYPDWLSRSVINSVDRTKQPTGHAFKVRISQRVINGELLLVVQNSYGRGIGDGGLQYFSREVVNREWAPFGAFMFLDADPDQVKQIRLNVFDYLARYIDRLNYAVVYKTLREMYSLFKRQSPEVPRIEPPIPAPIPAPQPKPAPALAESMQDMVRRVCREEKLDPEMARTLYATVAAESAFNPSAINHNIDKKPGSPTFGKTLSTDYGICQLNSKWYIGPKLDIKTPEEALKDPEKCVRVMCRAFKRGRAIDWIAYRNGSYKKFLPTA